MHGAKTRDCLISCLPSIAGDPKIWGEAARVRTKFLVGENAYFAYHLFVFMSVQDYRHNQRFAGHLVARDSLL